MRYWKISRGYENWAIQTESKKTLSRETKSKQQWSQSSENSRSVTERKRERISTESSRIQMILRANENWTAKNREFLIDTHTLHYGSAWLPPSQSQTRTRMIPWGMRKYMRCEGTNTWNYNMTRIGLLKVAISYTCNRCRDSMTRL